MKGEEFIEELKKHIRKVTGIVLSPVQVKALRNEIKDGRISEGVLSEKNPFSSQFQRLLRVITVEESYFFRYPGHFKFLSDILKEEIIPRARAEKRRVSILSLGCAKGEELYSIVMTVQKVLKLCGEVEVLAVGADINLEYLDRAEKAIYSPSSLRLLSEEEKGELFLKNGSMWILKKNFKPQVFFHPVNVVDWKTYPFSYAPFDVIFFRNVLIYIAPEYQMRVLKNILNMVLREGGYLFLGHADFIDVEKLPLKRSSIENVYVHMEKKMQRLKTEHVKKVEQGGVKREVKSLGEEKPRRVNFYHDVKEALRRGNIPHIKSLIEALRASTGRNDNNGVLAALLEAWLYLLNGSLENARELLEPYAQTGVLIPEVYYLLGYIHLEKGDLLLAMRELEKCLYLKDNFFPAYRLLKPVYKSLNRKADVRRVERMLKQFEEGKIAPEWGLVPEGEGVAL